MSYERGFRDSASLMHTNLENQPFPERLKIPCSINWVRHAILLYLWSLLKIEGYTQRTQEKRSLFSPREQLIGWQQISVAINLDWIQTNVGNTPVMPKLVIRICIWYHSNKSFNRIKDITCFVIFKFYLGFYFIIICWTRTLQPWLQKEP